MQADHRSGLCGTKPGSWFEQGGHVREPCNPDFLEQKSLIRIKSISPIAQADQQSGLCGTKPGSWFELGGPVWKLRNPDFLEQKSLT